MTWELLGLVFVASVFLAGGAVLSVSRFNPFPPWLVMLAIVLRIVGALARFDMIRLFYGGVADAQRYFNVGIQIARQVWSLDPYVFSYAFWFGGAGRWWGTPFMEKLTGFLLALTGPTMRGGYLLFSMLAFLGLYLMALAVFRHRPGRGAVRFAAWIWLWPSLWFWPSSIGKESLTVCAIGLAFYGYAGKRGRLSWIPYLLGLGLAFALRPHVGAVLALATAAAYWLRSWDRPSPRRIVELLLAGVLAVVFISSMASQFGLDNADLEGVQEFITYRTGQTLEGGSAIGQGPGGVLAIPGAFVNIWLRPFLWDAHNTMALLSALEVMLLWTLAVTRRHAILFSLRHWRRDRLLAFGLPLLAGYTLMIGLTFANLGIIARQRSPLFPFIFLLFTAAGAYAGGRPVFRSPGPRAAAPAAPAATESPFPPPASPPSAPPTPPPTSPPPPGTGASEAPA